MSKVIKKIKSKCTLALTALVAAGAMGGCSATSENEPLADDAEALSSNAYSVLGFESPSGWTLTAAPGVALSSSTTHSQGLTSVAVNAKGSVSLRSAAISVGSAITPDIAVDIQIPAHGSFGWTASAELFGECASTKLVKTSWGKRSLVGLPTGKFSTLGFKVPATSLTKLASGCQDLRLSVALTVPTSSTGSYLLDNVELGGPPAKVDCFVDSGSGSGFFATYTNAVTRPDQGTIELHYSVFHGNPSYEDRVYAINGIYVLENFSTVLPDGRIKRVETTSTPFEPHELVTYSDGKTMSFTMDGKSTNVVPVKTDPRTMKFTDGTAIPPMPLSQNLLDAMVALEKDASVNSGACFGGPGSTTAALLAQSDPLFGNGGVSGSKCTGCELGCDGKTGACVAAAVGTSLLCGPFALLCGAGEAAICVAYYESCESGCHKSGTDCCPVGCGGESDITTPIGACCYSGDSCARRATDDHAALCCGPGTTGCGGALCCSAGQKCATPTSGPKMVGIIRNAACCGPEMTNSRGECCTLGKCSTDSDCSGADACINGCCILG